MSERSPYHVGYRASPRRLAIDILAMSNCDHECRVALYKSKQRAVSARNAKGEDDGVAFELFKMKSGIARGASEDMFLHAIERLNLRSEEHTSELQSLAYLLFLLLL